MTPSLVAGLVGVGLVLAWLALFMLVSRLEARAKIHRRLREVQRMVLPQSTEADGMPVARPIRTAGGRMHFLNSRYPLAGGRRVLVLGGIGAVASGVLAWQMLLFLGANSPVAVVLGLGLAVAGFLQVGAGLEGARRRKYDELMLLMVDQVMQMVRFGMGTDAALQRVAEKMEEPLADSLGRINGVARFGVPVATALADEARRVRSRDLAMMAAVVKTNAETGAGVSDALDKLGAMLRERHEAARKAKAASAEARVTIWILAALPVIGVTAQAFQQPETIAYLIGEARHLIGIGVGLIAAGLVIARSMVRVTGV